MVGIRSFFARVLVLGAIVPSAACGRGESFSVSSPPTSPTAGVFTPAQDAPIVTTRQHHTATKLPGGDVLVIGGTSGGPVAQAERFAPGPQTFAAAGILVAARSRHSATLLDDDSVLLAGGEAASGPTSTAELWDPNTQSFVALGQNLAAPRRNHSAALLPGGSVLFLGGDAAGAPYAAMERFVPGTGFQATGTSLGQARTRHMTVISGNTVLVLGGFTDAGQATPTNSVEVIDGASFVARPPSGGGMNQPRAGAAIAILADGRILLAGGLGVGGQALASAEIYDPVRERATGVPQMSRARGSARAARLPDGRVLVVGGDSTADIFDPQTSTFVLATSQLTAARTGGHTVTSLGVLGALVFGGGAANTPAEVFEPQ